MAISAYDVQICVWKMIKFSTKTCVSVSKKHPYVTSGLFFLFLLYMCCPLFFWILIYSLPLAVSTWVVLRLRDGRRCREEREIERELKERESGGKLDKQTKLATLNSDKHGKEEEQGKEKDRKIKKAYSRVHSVRRRRAKEIACGDDTPEGRSRASESNGRDDATEEDEDEMEEEKINAVLSTDPNTDMVDKTPLADGSPKEIHEVEVEVDSLANTNVGSDVSIDHKIYHNPEIDKSLKLLKDDEDTQDEASKAMDVNIAEAETNKRLESLIARRRSQKMLNPPGRKSLVKTDHMPPISIPKINTWCSPSKVVGPFSPGPGSAPSVLIPMRNPFDLPYDPQEEKPDLTGDSFQQEFASGHSRDFTFCRHESFSLGPSLPMDFFEDRDDASSIDDFGFMRRRSSIGFHFSKPETEESDTDFGVTTEAESGMESETKSNIDSPNSDQIKEVIQVHENGSQSYSVEEDQDRVGPVQPNTRPNGLDELSLSSNSSSTGSAGSSEDERPPICKINREAILKSLSMRRNSVSVTDIEMEGHDQLQENNLSYANSALENASRLKQQYFADKPHKRHGMTFSIASDMQVEVSELSSPPLTIGENMSYQDDASAYDTEMERNTSWDGLDSWAGSSRLSEIEDNETRLTRANEAGASRSKKCDDTTPLRSMDDIKNCITTSSSTSELSEPHATDLRARESNTGEEQPPSKDAKFGSVIENNVSNEPVQHETSSDQAAMDSNGPPQEGVHHATISPKSVLQPILSVASFEHDGEDEVRLSGAHPTDHSSSNAPQNSTLLVQFTVGTSSNGAAEAQQAPSRTLPSNVEANDIVSVKQKAKIQENDHHLKEAVGGSSSKALEITEPTPNTREESSSGALTKAEYSESASGKMKIEEGETSSRSSNNAGEVSRDDIEAGNIPTTLSNQRDYSISSLSNEKETAIQESTHNEVEDKDNHASHKRNQADEEAQQHDDLHDSEAK